MDSIAQLALMTKAKLVFEQPGTFLCFPATTPLNYSAGQLNFAQTTSPATMVVFSEFSRLTNSLPRGVIFQPELDVLLWDVYQQVLQNAQVAQGDLTPEQTADLQKATAFLYTQGPGGTQSDSPALISYKQHQQAWFLATQNYKAQQITATTSNDPARQVQWQNTDEPVARAQVDAAESAWETDGFKAQVEQAQQVERTTAELSPQLKWQDWIAHCNPDIDFLTDANNQTFAPTFYSPSDVTEQTTWPAFTVHAAEIPELLKQAPKELADLFETASGAPGIDSLSFEFCSVVLNRAWLQPVVFEERFWRFADPSIQISDGNNPPNGDFPAYITALVLARNIVETTQVTNGTVQQQPIRSLPPIFLRPNPAPIVRAVPMPVKPAASGQPGWQWCKKCQVLAFAGSPSLGGCPAGGVHDYQGSGDYTLVLNVPGASGQHNWRWCRKCQGLAFAGSSSPGACPAGGAHDHQGSGDYALEVSSPPATRSVPVAAASHLEVPRNVSFVGFRPVPVQTQTAPANKVTAGVTSTPAGSSSPAPQPSAGAGQISILAFICKQFPKCPNPDPALNWG
jgi:hypothetical protein